MRFLANQYTERDGVEQRLIAGCFGIFGHGNVAGVGQALLEQRRATCPTCSRATSRRWSTPPPATRASSNRLVDATPAPPRSARARPTWSPAPRWPRSTACRCCCCRATSSPRRVASPVLQELEDPASLDVSVNDCFRPVSRFWDRINRPEQLLSSRARRDARAHRPGRDRRGHARAAAGRPGRGLRLAGGVLRRAASGTSRRPPAEPERARRGRRAAARRARGR